MLFNYHFKLNLDQKLDLVDRQAILKHKKEKDEYKELVEVLRNEVAMKEEMIQTTGVRELHLPSSPRISRTCRNMLRQPRQTWRHSCTL